ncbi:PLD-like domain-containing protein [Sarocladium implicatum]|nr:PLD-like domain-containing protein [Sarocladium implicatum]
MSSQYIIDLCQQPATVSSELASHPERGPSDIASELYHSRPRHVPDMTFEHEHDAMETAVRCGRWRERPSNLFLLAYADALKCLTKNPLSGMVSPPLMGSHGRVPVTVIAPLADIARHCASMIVKARKEVFFVTCVWSPSEAQRLIKDALIELSKRAGERNERVAVRMMYDQAGPSHMFEAHQRIKPEAYDSKHVQLPHPDEVQHLDLQVSSLHTVLMGTLHAKFCIVDRQAAMVMSNNIEDNQNLEMLTHLEGPIVASVYDSAIITWGKALRESDDKLGFAQELRVDESRVTDQEIKDLNNRYVGESYLHAANEQLNLEFKTQTEPSGPEIMKGEEMVPFVSTNTEDTVPMAVVSRHAYGGVDSGDTHMPQTEAWLALIREAESSIFIQTPDLNAGPLLPALADALARGVDVTYYYSFGYNDAGEMIPGQGGTNEQAARKLIALAKARRDGGEPINLEKQLNIHAYVAKDQDHPIHHSFRLRSSHIKLLIVDDAVGIQGSGNQDTQSWCHSQELNIMVDSREICRKWRDAIDRNQRTKAYGKVAGDGVWRDLVGQAGPGYSGDPGMIGGLVKGIVGMVNKTARQRSTN